MIVVLEGLDNCGKTMQSNLLHNRFKKEGYEVIISKEFTSSIGDILTRSFKTKPYSPIMKTFLFAADRQERLEEISIDNNGKSSIIIFDRFIHSALAYRGAEGVDLDFVKIVNKYVPQIDLGIYIDISPEESIARNKDGKFNIKYSSKMLGQIRERYLSFVESRELVLVDGQQDVQTINNNIYNMIISKGELLGEF